MVTLNTLGVRTNFKMELDLPILSAQGYYRVARKLQVDSTSKARKRIVTPNRRRMPKDTGDLRKSFRAVRPRRPRGRSYITCIDTRFLFYYYFQTLEWERFRQDMVDEAADIILESLQDALIEEGFSR